MQEITTYKEQKIWLNDGAKFCVEINGLTKRFSSLQSAKNAIDKEILVTFQPVEVFIVESNGYPERVYTLKRIRLEKYIEEKGHRSRKYRYLLDSKEQRYRIGGYNNPGFVSLKDEAKMRKLVSERNEQGRIEQTAEKQSKKILERMKKVFINLDPHPESQ